MVGFQSVEGIGSGQNLPHRVHDRTTSANRIHCDERCTDPGDQFPGSGGRGGPHSGYRIQTMTDNRRITHPARNLVGEPTGRAACSQYAGFIEGQGANGVMTEQSSASQTIIHGTNPGRPITRFISPMRLVLPDLPGPASFRGEKIRFRKTMGIGEAISILPAEQAMLRALHHQATHTCRMLVSLKAANTSKGSWPQHHRTVKAHLSFRIRQTAISDRINRWVEVRMTADRLNCGQRAIFIETRPCKRIGCGSERPG